MNCNKISKEEVPQKFVDWLLEMGCPAEKIPAVEKISEMCRGQYYLVWRSLMEHVEPKDVIRQKRLQVFYNDVQKWKKTSPFSERNTNAVMPEPLALWQEHTVLKNKVADMEDRVNSSQNKLKTLTDKISMKLPQRNIFRERIEDLQRRAWLLQQVAADLKAKKQNLEETRSIADSLCGLDEETDVKTKLEKCISILRKQQLSDAGSSSLLAANPVACSSVKSTNQENDAEHVSSLLKCRADAIWPLLCERRAALVTALAAGDRDTATKSSTTPQSVLAHTAALHCNLALEAMKNKVHIKQTKKRLTTAVNELNNQLSGDSCELLVVRCERAHRAARVDALRALLTDVSSRSGLFEVSGESESQPNHGRNIAALDKIIESKRDELMKLLTNLAATEEKIFNIRDCLIHVFNSFQKDLPVQGTEKYRGQLEFPAESMAIVRQFYEERRERKRNKVELSMELDASGNCSFMDPTDNNANPRFIDELKIYLKKFCLEKNRKLVLESGEKIWIFETLHAAHSRLLTKWQEGEVAPLLCPSVSLSSSVASLIELMRSKLAMEATVKEIESAKIRELNIDLPPKKAEEDQTTDKIKKRLNENLLSLKKTTKTLELGQENLEFWSENQVKRYISPRRKVEGKTYKDYEAICRETLSDEESQRAKVSPRARRADERAARAAPR